MVCQAGQTARVTLPGGSKKDWDGPIDITCENGALPEEEIRVDIHVRAVITTTYGGGRKQTDTYNQYSYNFSGYSPYAPVKGSRVRIDGNLTYFEVSCLMGSPLRQRWLPFASWANTYQTASCEIISIKKRWAPDQGKDYLKKIITVKRGEQELYQAQYDSCAFSVECIIPCPPNTLDCGGCCLDCAGIFNQLSALEQKILSLK